jgi:trans-2-enoyl-CoA reductase
LPKEKGKRTNKDLQQPVKQILYGGIVVKKEFKELQNYKNYKKEQQE